MNRKNKNTNTEIQRLERLANTIEKIAIGLILLCVLGICIGQAFF